MCKDPEAGAQIAREKVAKDEGGQISRVRAFGAWILVFIPRAMAVIKVFKAELHLAGAIGRMCILTTSP